MANDNAATSRDITTMPHDSASDAARGVAGQMVGALTALSESEQHMDAIAKISEKFAEVVCSRMSEFQHQHQNDQDELARDNRLRDALAENARLGEQLAELKTAATELVCESVNTPSSKRVVRCLARS